MNAFEQFLTKARPYIAVALGTIPVTLALTDYVGYPCRVRGASMEPTLQGYGTNCCSTKAALFGDMIWLNKVRQNKKINRGQVVIVRSVTNPDKLLVKRVHALSGDCVAMDRGCGGPLVVPPGQIWIEGDNAHNSLDSTTFGAVPLALVVATANYIVWPPSRIGPIAPEAPNHLRPRETLVGRLIQSRSDWEWVIKSARVT